MDVQLYVYDLSRGMARQFSAAFLGTQIDAVYHTSLVFGNVEYFFGAGIQRTRPGMTHHGQPMEIVPLGQTQLDPETIADYLQSMKQVYTAESYDLFLNNCNNFTNDFAQFLVGRGIPDHITSLPRTVLNTPFGQMLQPQLDRAMRGVTQAPLPESSDLLSNTNKSSITNGQPMASRRAQVRNVTTTTELDALLAQAASSCAVVFFTSKTCPPCKICYPVYDSLAAELDKKVILIKIDISVAYGIAAQYQVRATPTFMTFLHGEKLEEWKGADTATLEQKTRLLVQMAHPPSPHTALKLPTLQKRYETPVLYSKVPPLEKLMVQLGDAASDPTILSLRDFVQRRSSSETAASVPLPDLRAVSHSIRNWIPKVTPPKLFALLDLLRVATVDPRVSGFFAEEDVSSSLYLNILERLTGDEEYPYSTHLTAVQLGCNLFTSPQYPSKLLGNSEIAEPLMSLIAISLLDREHPTLRVSAASLAFNVTAWNHRMRLEGAPDVLEEGTQIELAASLVEAVSRESSQDALKGLVLALGLLSYGSQPNGELKGVLTALDAEEVLSSKKIDSQPSLINEVRQVVS